MDTNLKIQLLAKYFSSRGHEKGSKTDAIFVRDIIAQEIQTYKESIIRTSLTSAIAEQQSQEIDIKDLL
jgi:hypothetical protein